MPLINPSQTTDLSLLETARDIANYLHNAAVLANKQASELLSMEDGALTTWLRSKASELSDLLTKHATTGAGINTAINAVNATLSEAGIATVPTLVDVSPFADKLAAQGRQIDFATLTVSTIPTPEPEPEPE